MESGLKPSPSWMICSDLQTVERLSAVTDLRYLHRQLYQLAGLLTRVHETTVKLHVAAAPIFSFGRLIRGVVVLVRGEAAAKRSLTSVRKHGHDVTEAAVEASQQDGGAVIWRDGNQQIKHVSETLNSISETVSLA